MKKLLYISYVDYEKKTELGVIKKIEGQKKAFHSFGYSIDHLKISGQEVRINEKSIFSISSKVDYWIRLPLALSTHFKHSGASYNLVYVRKDLFSPLHYFLFKRLRKISGHILLEIPTYPYKMEVKSGLWTPVLLFLDRLNNLLIKNTLSFIITTQNYRRILGVDTIRIKNGYDFSGVTKWLRKKEDGMIRLVAVANFNFWHGIDRLIRGIHHYNLSKLPDKRRVILHLVGSGEELEKHRSMSRELNLKNIIFHGPKYGAALDEIYREADIGVGALGLYRRGSSFQSLLKNVEYCYYGIPFITGNPDEDFEDAPFVLEFANDDTPIDIQKVIEWFEGLDIRPEDIQAAGIASSSWDNQIKIMLDHLQ